MAEEVTDKERANFCDYFRGRAGLVAAGGAGAGEAARINGDKERQLKEITSEAYREAQGIKGKADAEAARIYARAYNRDPEFYRFLKTMETYRSTIDPETTMVLTTDGDFYRYLDKAR